MWDPEQAIRSELLSSEILRWTGRPAVARVLLASGLPILFLVFWEAMAIHAAVSPVRAWLEAGRPWESLSLAHVAMIAVGLLFLARAAGPVFAASRTAYGITNRRVIVVSRLTARRVQSVEGASIGGVDRTERSNGSGDIVIRPGGQADHSLALIGVPDVRQVDGEGRAAPGQFACCGRPGQWPAADIGKPRLPIPGRTKAGEPGSGRHVAE